MNAPPALTSQNGRTYPPREKDRRPVPPQSRRQCWWAALLLFCAWLLSVSGNWPLLRHNPVTFTALVPGLAVAIYVEHQLLQHLTANHRPAENNRLFPTLGAGNWITLARAFWVIILAGFLPGAILPGHQLLSDFAVTWAPGVIYLGVSLADLLDGFIARRGDHETELGKILDIETDAAGLLVASLVAVAYGRLPVTYLLVGLAYYIFISAVRLRQRRALSVVAWRSRPYARIIAGCQMGLVAVVLLPLFKPEFSFIAGYVFMTPLVIGFIRDWLVVSGRLPTNDEQQARADYQVRSLLQQLSPVLRLLLVAGGIITLTGSGIYQTQLIWQVAHSLCCLMAGIGFMGRSAALLLILLLGSKLSPFGTSILPITMFSIAAVLVLAGTGRISLWAPEESLLYRRTNKGVKQPGAAI